jgi:molybdopterin converting factor small subunit
VIRVVLPGPLRVLAQCEGEVLLDIAAPVTQRTILDALEARYPQLLGTIRDANTKRRRAFVRFFACERDLSHDDPDTEMPAPVTEGREPLLIVGAMAGG